MPPTTDTASPLPGPPRKRSLILAGGGLKVAFQAGVLQVWLDEAQVHFDHADGASGGCFNLAMVCQGMSGQQIADNWRTLDPLAGVSLNWTQFERLYFASSMFTLDAYRQHVFPRWGLDWSRIRASPLDATFNVYNFSRNRLECLVPSAMDEDHMCACVSLPMWFPPVKLGSDNYIDAVYVTDANLEQAILRGADELWVIWTVSESGQWNNGFVANYFQIIEASANGTFRRIVERIEANNAAIAAGRPGEFGRLIELKILRAEVDLNYLINFSADRVAEAVNQGVATARAWCLQNGIQFRALPDVVPQRLTSAPISLEFTEEMKGFLTIGETDYDSGFRKGERDGTAAMVHLTIRTGDLDRFIVEPQHEATVEGYFESPVFGGRRPITKGVFNLLVDTKQVGRKAMYYRLEFTGQHDEPLTLLGFKDVRDGDGSDAWTHTTTLFTRILRGHVGVEGDGQAVVEASGIIRIHLLDFFDELASFRVSAPTIAERATALTRFGTFFLGKLWDVYARYILPASPL